MDFSVKSGQPAKQRSACTVVGIFEKGDLTPAAAALDEASGGAVKALIKGGDLKKARPGQGIFLHRPAQLPCDRLLVVQCGKADELNDARFRQILKGALTTAAGTATKDALLCLLELPVEGRDLTWKARQAATLAGDALYRFDQLKSEKAAKERPPLRKVTLLVGDKGETAAAEQGVAEGSAVRAGMDLAKDLANLPGNVCTPSYLADQAKAMGRKYGSIKVNVLGEKEMKQLGMGALLGVSRGSRQAPKLITLEYSGGRKKDKPVVLVGKGLTFDAGGISLKPAQAMDEMKYDMCGGASVLGAVKAAAEMKLPLNLVGVVPASENLPDGAANKPGDILTSMSGQTIEVLNTDAEGRLILCDALTYSERFDPAVVIDIATLTGACVIALGKQASGLLSTDDELAEALLAAGQTSGDRAWRLPLWEEYQEQLKSPFADMANIGGREAGTITAACFLSRFTKKFRWAHLDIAGTAWTSGNDKGATGRPVPLLMQYLLDRRSQ
jgi:leucyl aminopeptidase